MVRPPYLKAGVPHKELFSEMEALRVYDGRGSVRLLEADSEQGDNNYGTAIPWHDADRNGR